MFGLLTWVAYRPTSLSGESDSSLLPKNGWVSGSITTVGRMRVDYEWQINGGILAS